MPVSKNKNHLGVAIGYGRLGVFCCIAFLSAPAYAYVDPGTGSLAVQFLIGGAVALAFTIKTYYYSIRSKIRSMLGRPDPGHVDVESDKSDVAHSPDQSD